MGGKQARPEASYNAKSFLGVFRYSGHAVKLVWQTSAKLTLGLVFLSLLAGVLPAAIAYVGKWLVDAVVLSAKTGAAADRADAIRYVM